MGIMCSCSQEHTSTLKPTKKVSLHLKSTVQTDVSVSSPQINQQTSSNLYNVVTHHNCFTSFQIVCQLGSGGQADIFEIKPSFNDQNSNETAENNSVTYVLKRIYKNNSVNRIESLELAKSILMSNSCPFIVKGISTTEDHDFIYNIMEKAQGGDLGTFIHPYSIKSQLFKRLGQEAIKFVAAGVILGLQYLHRNNFIYCDLKLENILIASDGYPRLTDFEMVLKGRYASSKGYRGTKEYVAPEILLQDQIDKSIDLWALGVLLNILASEETPFQTQNLSQQKFIIECKRKQNKHKSQTKWVSRKLISLINELLQVNPKQRLGYCSLSQIKGHSFFNGFDWLKYERKQLQSPLKSIIEIETEINQNKRKEKISVSMVKIRNKRKESADRETECDQFVEAFPQLEL